MQQDKLVWGPIEANDAHLAIPLQTYVWSRVLLSLRDLLKIKDDDNFRMENFILKYSAVKYGFLNNLSENLNIINNIISIN